MHSITKLFLATIFAATSLFAVAPHYKLNIDFQKVNEPFLATAYQGADTYYDIYLYENKVAFTNSSITNMVFAYQPFANSTALITGTQISFVSNCAVIFFPATNMYWPVKMGRAQISLMDGGTRYDFRDGYMSVQKSLLHLNPPAYPAYSLLNWMSNSLPIGSGLAWINGKLIADSTLSDNLYWTNYPAMIEGATNNLSPDNLSWTNKLDASATNGFIKLSEVPPDNLAWTNKLDPSATNTLAPRSWVAGFSNAPATWNSDFHTVDVALPDGVTGQMFQENHVYGKNNTGVVISNGAVCYIATASGFNCGFEPANATNGFLISLRTIGIATHNIGIGASGKVTTFGNVNDLNTTHLIEGQPVYLDSVSGRATTNSATYPNANVHLGVCLRSHASAGRIYVTVQSSPHAQDIGAATTVHSQPISTITNAGNLAYSNSLTYTDVGGASAAQGALADTAWQNPASATNWTWTSDGAQITLTGYSGGSSMIVPPMLDGLPVTKIGANAFRQNYTITSVALGDNLKSIGSSAFMDCTNLSGYLTFPLTFTSFGSDVVRNSGITSVYFYGNKPTGSGMWGTSDVTTNYVYGSTATGWGDTFGGLPVVRLPLYGSGASLTSLDLNPSLTNPIAKALSAVQTNDARYLASLTNTLPATNPLGYIVVSNGVTYIGTGIVAGVTGAITNGQSGVTLGSNTLFAGNVAITGTTDNVQLSIRANGTQNSNVFEVWTSPTFRAFDVAANGNTTISGSQILSGGLTQSSTHVGALNGSSFSPTFNSAGTSQSVAGVKYLATYNQPNATNVYNTDLLINRTQTSIGVNPLSQLLIDAQVGGVSKFSVDNQGSVNLASNLVVGSKVTSEIITVNNSATLNALITPSIYGQSATLPLIFHPYTGNPVSAGGGSLDAFRFGSSVANQRTNGIHAYLSIKPVYNQATGTATNTDLLISRTETAIGSGPQKLINAQVGGVSKFSVDNTGNLTVGGTITSGGNSLSGGYIANPADLLPFVVNGTATFTSAMLSSNAFWYITPTNTTVFATDANLTNSAVVSMLSLDLFYNAQTFSFQAGMMTNTATLVSNQFNNVIFYKSYGATILTGK